MSGMIDKHKPSGFIAQNGPLIIAGGSPDTAIVVSPEVSTVRYDSNSGSDDFVAINIQSPDRQMEAQASVNYSHRTTPANPLVSVGEEPLTVHLSFDGNDTGKVSNSGNRSTHYVIHASGDNNQLIVPDLENASVGGTNLDGVTIIGN